MHALMRLPVSDTRWAIALFSSVRLDESFVVCRQVWKMSDDL